MTCESRALFMLPTDTMGGAERVVRTLALEAARSRTFQCIDVFILSGARTGTLDELEQYPGIRLLYSGAGSERGGIWPAMRIMRQARYSFVFSSATQLNALASLMRRIGWLKTDRLVARESTQLFDLDIGTAGTFLRLLYLFYGSQDLIVCQTGRMLQGFDRGTGGRFRHLLRVLPNPIDFDRIAAGVASPPPEDLLRIPTERTKIVWCGRMARIKSPDRAIEALRTLHDMGERNVHLVMIGDGPMRGELEELARCLGLEDYVTFVGRVENPSTVMAQCKIGLLTADVEGFPNTLLEMLASGVERVVMTNSAGDLDTLPRVLVTDIHDAASLSRLIYDCLQMKNQVDAIEPFLKERKPSKILMELVR